MSFIIPSPQKKAIFSARILWGFNKQRPPRQDARSFWPCLYKKRSVPPSRFLSLFSIHMPFFSLSGCEKRGRMCAAGHRLCPATVMCMRNSRLHAIIPAFAPGFENNASLHHFPPPSRRSPTRSIGYALCLTNPLFARGSFTAKRNRGIFQNASQPFVLEFVHKADIKPPHIEPLDILSEQINHIAVGNPAALLRRHASQKRAPLRT